MISLLCWNARGIGNKNTSNSLRRLLEIHKVDMLAILEPKIPNERLERKARSWKFENFMHGGQANDHIWVMWSDNLEVHNFVWGDQHASCKVKLRNSEFVISISFVYAACSNHGRDRLWQDLLRFGWSISGPWITVGDFNVISSWNEKKGGNRIDDGAMSAFNNFQIQAGLSDVGFIGNPFTWCNNQRGIKRIWKRLDRALLNGDAFAAFPAFSVHHLPRQSSDHSPVLLCLDKRLKGKSRFHYMRVWETHPGFQKVVKEAWEGCAHSSPILNFCLKLQKLRKILHVWNWSSFGDLRRKLSESEALIASKENSLSQCWNAVLAREIEQEKDKHADTLKLHLDTVQDKARLNWVEEGDRSTKFFSAAIKVRSMQIRACMRVGDGAQFSDNDAVGNAASLFFSSLFNSHTPYARNENFNLFEPMITEEDNKSLTGLPTKDEIWKTIRGMKLDSAPSPDGFNGYFYASCWSIIGDDLCHAILDFFKGGLLPRNLTATILTLIPKTSGASSLDELRPISLCNFAHKVISKVLSNRLSEVLPKVISDEQTGFTPGRSIHENIALAHSLVHDIDKKVDGGNIMCKLALSKAYDRLSWSFLLQVMRHMGFSEGWCDLIFQSISNCWYSVKWAGNLYGFFRSTRGLRQGDPLSPALFILAMEWLSMALKKAMDLGEVKAFSTKSGAIPISHLMFADDILVFLNGRKRSMDNFMNILRRFCSFAGQELNLSKCRVFLSKNISISRRNDILQRTGFQLGVFPTKYLGVPLFKGRAKVEYYSFLEDKMKAKLSGWMRSFLSMGGRLTLLNSVLNSMSSHCLAAQPVPRTITRRLSTLMANFLWNQGPQKRKHWVSWDKVCRPKEMGGLGVRSLDSIKMGLHGRLAWNYLLKRSLWAKHAASRFKSYLRGPSLWNEIAHIIDAVKEGVGWRFGEGNTLVARYCETTGSQCSSYLANMPIRRVLTTTSFKQDLFLSISPLQQNELSGIVWSDLPDRLLWRGSVDGSFSMKSFCRSFQTMHAKEEGAKSIWQQWIPTKISCFLWKCRRGAVPTDDRIMSSGIALVSKCSCCTKPCIESLNHLFFRSELADVVWRFLRGVFSCQRPFSIDQLFKIWLAPLRKKDGVACLRVGMVCCAVWEIWKARNTLRFEGTKANIIRSTIKWAALIVHSLPSSLFASSLAARTLQRLHVHQLKILPDRGHWRIWHPHHSGITLSFSIVVVGSTTFGSWIFRDAGRSFVGAFGTRVRIDFDFKDVIKWLDAAINNSKIRPDAFHSSSVFMAHLQDRYEVCIPWDTIYLARDFRARLNNPVFLRVCPMLNNPAIALASSRFSGFTKDMWQLPRSVQIALRGDSLGLQALCPDKICSFKHIGSSSSSLSSRDM